MSHTNTHFYFGTVTKSVGLKGEMIVKNLSVQVALDKEIEFVFLEINKQLTPFLVEQLSFRKKGEAVLKLQDVGSLEQCAQYLKQDVYLTNDLKLKVQKGSFLYEDFIGFKAIDKLYGEIGQVQNVLTYPQQQIFEISFKGKEILIPANDTFIEKVDVKGKMLYLNAPPGLIDLYLNEKQDKEEE
jgi:16S rRNA processing protein RimM